MHFYPESTDEKIDNVPSHYDDFNQESINKRSIAACSNLRANIKSDTLYFRLIIFDDDGK